MPLIHSASKEAFSANVAKEREHGKPLDVALAIAHSIQDEARSREHKKSEDANAGSPHAKNPHS